jgi:aminopeptidase YwaD
VRSAIPAAERAFALVRAELSGARALETVAFVEQRWRLPGNRGFDESIDHVIAGLRTSGYVEESSDTGSALTYRVESRPLRAPAWEPESALVVIDGQSEPLLRFATNRNMMAINSYATPAGGVTAEVVQVPAIDAAGFARADVEGKIVLADAPIGRLFTEAVQRRGALGVFSYHMPEYLRPAEHRHSIQFGSIPVDEGKRSWGILLSYAARERLRAALATGPVRVRVVTLASFRPGTARTVIADVHGTDRPDERYVFSAHVQEPGANDNASGVGAQLEMARVAASLVTSRKLQPRRSITFIFGDEIAQTRDYLADGGRARSVRWGTSLDMVGENTAVTGGTFLIEKMPDPSAIWTRGEDRHTAWGGETLSEKDMFPHYLNDFVLSRARDLAAATGWAVSTNPYEGGSDHVPFLDARKPAVLLWHFTDEFYHTDGDRLDKVSPNELSNVATTALVAALTLTTADSLTARALVAELEGAARKRLDAEEKLGTQAVTGGGDREREAKILGAWGTWYRDAIRTVADVEVGGPSPGTRKAIEDAASRIHRDAAARANRLGRSR